jgi:hypothetical protein
MAVPTQIAQLLEGIRQTTRREFFVCITHLSRSQRCSYPCHARGAVDTDEVTIALVADNLTFVMLELEATVAVATGDLEQPFVLDLAWADDFHSAVPFSDPLSSHQPLLSGSFNSSLA